MKIQYDATGDNTQMASSRERNTGNITLKEVGQRIIIDGVPFYVGQSVEEKKHPGRIGQIEMIIISRKFDVPAIHCAFSQFQNVLPPSDVVFPTVGFTELEQRDDDFFEGLRVGDAIDNEVRESLYNTLPRLIDNPDYFQLTGVVGHSVNEKGKSVPLYLTVKRFGNESASWRYVGHCPRGDDIHMNCDFVRSA